MAKDFIPVCEPTLGKEEVDNVVQAIKSGWISSKGSFIDDFERQFSAYIGAKHGISVCNGTAALHVALHATGIGRGDEVIMPSFTMVATADAALYVGAKPVFVDSEARTWNMDVTKVEKLVTKKTRAIMPMHTYGHPVDMGPVLEIAGRHGLLVIEDAAEAHGAEYKGKRVGCMGAAGCFSFYANKIITTGEGGMVLTNDDETARKARLFKDLAHSERQRFLHDGVGYNYRMTNMQAALGVAQMTKIGMFVEARRRNAMTYNSMLKDVEGIVTPPEAKWAKNVYWMYGILVEDSFGLGRDRLMAELERKGIGTRSFFTPMNRQPFIRSMGLANGRFPVAEMLGSRGLYLPSSSSLTREQIERVCDAIKEIGKSKGG